MTSGGSVSLTADDVVLISTIHLRSADSITIQPSTIGRAIKVGTETAGSLSLTDAEWDRVTVGTVNVGDAKSGTISVSSTVTFATSTDLSLNTEVANSKTINASGGSIVAAQLNLQVRNLGVGSSSSPLRFNATTLIANTGRSDGSQFLH